MPEYFALDFETTGLSPAHDRIVTAAVVGPGDFALDLLLNPGIPIGERAMATHGITDARASHGVDYAEGVRRIGDALAAGWRSGATLVGHNILGFDLPMLRMSERAVFGSARTEFGPLLDTFDAFREAFPGQRARLADACAVLGVPPGVAHEAHSDALAALTVARRLASCDA